MRPCERENWLIRLVLSLFIVCGVAVIVIVGELWGDGGLWALLTVVILFIAGLSRKANA